MKPWQVLGIAALVLNGLIMLALLFAGKADLLRTVAAGAILPVLISGGLLAWAEQSNTLSLQNLQKINIIGFFFKIILLGAWSVLLLGAGTLDKVTFIVILLVNFLAWHGVEAYYWPLFKVVKVQNDGEKS